MKGERIFVRESHDFEEARMKLEELGFSAGYLNPKNLFAIYYNRGINAICSVEYYKGKILFCFSSSNFKNIITQDIELLPKYFSMLKDLARFSSSRKISISRAHIVSEKEVDEIVAKNRNIVNENLKFKWPEDEAGVMFLFGLRHSNLSESEHKILEDIKLSRLKKMSYDVQFMIDCNGSYSQKNQKNKKNIKKKKFKKKII